MMRLRWWVRLAQSLGRGEPSDCWAAANLLGKGDCKWAMIARFAQRTRTAFIHTVTANQWGGFVLVFAAPPRPLQCPTIECVWHELCSGRCILTSWWLVSKSFSSIEAGVFWTLGRKISILTSFQRCVQLHEVLITVNELAAIVFVWHFTAQHTSAAEVKRFAM